MGRTDFSLATSLVERIAISVGTMATRLRGRLMVGRLTLDQVVKVRVLAPQPQKEHERGARRRLVSAVCQKGVQACMPRAFWIAASPFSVPELAFEGAHRREQDCRRMTELLSHVGDVAATAQKHSRVCPM
jgi:hypothetical protein